MQCQLMLLINIDTYSLENRSQTDEIILAPGIPFEGPVMHSPSPKHPGVFVYNTKYSANRMSTSVLAVFPPI